MPSCIVSVGDIECVAEFDYFPPEGDGIHTPEYEAEAHVTALLWDGRDMIGVWEALREHTRTIIQIRCIESMSEADDEAQIARYEWEREAVA